MTSQRIEWNGMAVALSRRKARFQGWNICAGYMNGFMGAPWFAIGCPGERLSEGSRSPMVHHLSRQSRDRQDYGAERRRGKGDTSWKVQQPKAPHRRFGSAKSREGNQRMKKSAIILAAAATFLASISISAPASAASWNWGFSTPWFGVQQDRSINSRSFRANDSVRVGPYRWSGGLKLGRDHVNRCSARYRSYDSATDTFVTFSGERKRCRL
jgi:hypothetical protein